VTTLEKNGASKPAVPAAPAVAKRGPVDLFEQIEQEMETMRRQMLRFFGRPSSEPIRPATLTDMAWAPTVDAYEQDGTFVVKAELPGVKRDGTE
jgi:HSP20 family molecular chaperone IbpA